MILKYKVFFVALLSFFLTACGGGGSSSSNILTTVALDDAYTGSSNKAMLTQSNSMEFVVALFGRSSGDTIIPSSSSSAKNPKPTLNTFQSQAILSNLSNKISAKPNDGSLNYQARSINESESCYGGGSISISGELNNANIGKITFQMDNCSEDDVTINGSIIMDITKYDSNSDEPTEYTISFNNLSMSFQGETFSAIGTQSFIRDDNYIYTIVELKLPGC